MGDVLWGCVFSGQLATNTGADRHGLVALTQSGGLTQYMSNTPSTWYLLISSQKLLPVSLPELSVVG